MLSKKGVYILILQFYNFDLAYIVIIQCDESSNSCTYFFRVFIYDSVQLFVSSICTFYFHYFVSYIVLCKTHSLTIN